MEFVLSNKSLERKGDPLHHLNSVSLLILSDSDISHGLHTLDSIKLRQRNVLDKNTFRNGLMRILILSETFRN